MTTDNTTPHGQHTPEYMAACKQVAIDWRNLAHAIRKEDGYASHVTEERKEQNLNQMLADADRIEAGHVDNFTIAQRVQYALTGKCEPLLKATGGRDV